MSDTKPALPEPDGYFYEVDGYFGIHRQFDTAPYNGMRPHRTVGYFTADTTRAAIDAAAAEARAEIANLKTVMIAAAEEIAAHWEAHCDAEGYGPQNLLRRLEEGIPSEYGYTAGAFAELKAKAEARAVPEGWQSVIHSVLHNNGGPIDAGSTVDGKDYVMVLRSDFDALAALAATPSPAEPPKPAVRTHGDGNAR